MQQTCSRLRLRMVIVGRLTALANLANIAGCE
jgi:hypothetical protein